jgi:branched-chain amino acid transport system ATP-binding protein
MTAEPLLIVRDVSVRFGGIAALRGIDMTVDQEECVGVIGPNGAGKSTLMNAISGLVRVSGGRITLDGFDLMRAPVARRAELGIGRTFQHSRLFSGLPVIDQLLCGHYCRSRYGLLGALTRGPGVQREERALRDRAQALLDRLGIGHMSRLSVDELSGAHRRLVDLGRALMIDPRVLLLDEVAAGLTDQEKRDLVELLRSTQAESLTAMIVIEHDLDFVRALAGRTVVISEGGLLASGKTAEVLSRPEVLEAYIGDLEEAAS